MLLGVSAIDSILYLKGLLLFVAILNQINQKQQSLLRCGGVDD